MPNSKSAEKRVRQNRKRRERQQQQRSRLKTAIKKAMDETDPDAAAELNREAAALLDRYASRGLLHQNKANRKKSQLARHLQEVGGTP